ncbi:hypothetical protein RV134_320062 [Roseovarius sp. EC-HK134]|nr:hypothetical protein RV420_370017 [Roseovarius sp. EC-SD190]VVT22897.1 hypothetical protein RV134_320062 [Roseovarius sp. EC-HK134]
MEAFHGDRGQSAWKWISESDNQKEHKEADEICRLSECRLSIFFYLKTVNPATASPSTGSYTTATACLARVRPT